MTTMNRITGILQLTSPLHCASPEKHADRKNFTLTTTMPFITPRGTQRIPYFPGNDLRGRLRRHAANIVLDHITVDQKLKGIELYSGLSCGSVNNSPNTGDLSAEEILRARDNVYMGLFGGGAQLLRSRFAPADLVPVLADLIDRGTVPREFGEPGEHTFTPVRHTADGEKPLEGWQLVSERTLFKRDDVFTLARPDEIEKHIENARDHVTDYQTFVLSGSQDRKADKKRVEAKEIRADEATKKVGLQNMFQIETVAAGTPMYFKIDFTDDIRDVHVGLLVMALRGLVREQALGGWSRAGLGRFRTNLSLTRADNTYQVFDGEWAAGDAQLSQAVLPFTDAACEALKNLSADEMLAFFKPREVKKRGKADVAAEVE